MPTEILLPQWGMEMDEGTVVRWLKKEGDQVQEGEPLVEIETAKLTTELESFASGTLARIVVPEGDTVPIRAVLAVITAPGEAMPASVAEAPAAPAALRAAVDSPVAVGRLSVQVVPAARRLAREHGIDLASVQGSGPNGRILIADVESAIAAQPPGVEPGSPHQSTGDAFIRESEEQVPYDTGRRPEAAPIQGIRRTIAERMLQSLQTMAQVTLTTEANVSQAMLLREGLSRHLDGVSLSPLHLVVKAAARALLEHPRLNAIQTGNVVQPLEEVNIGLAVSLAEGLVTPVLRDVPGKSLGTIAREARELADRARENRATPRDVSGGSFTITNLGMYDIDGFTPIINPPQVGILGVGRVVDKPVIQDGEFANAAMMFLSLTFDHRVVDGAPAAEFLQTVKGFLEDPWWMVA